MSIHSIQERDNRGRWKSMGGSNGSAGEHSISARAPRSESEKTSRDITKTVIPFMSAIVLCVAIFGAGTGVGRYLTGTDDRIGGIERDVSEMKADVKEIKKTLQKKTARL